MKLKTQPKWIQELVKEFGLDPKQLRIDVSLMPSENSSNSYFGEIYITVTNQKDKREKRNATND